MPDQAPQQRRLGLRKEGLGYNLLQNGPHVKAKGREQKQRSPSTDIDAPPKDSSDEASTVYDVELFDTEPLPSKRRRTGKYELALESTKSRSPQSGSDNGVSELANEPSRISASSFSSSNRRSGRQSGSQKAFKRPSEATKAVVVVEAEDPTSTWATKQKKKKATYGTNPRNIHTAPPPKEIKKDAEEQSITPVRKSKAGFLTFNKEAVEPLLDKLESETTRVGFKAPFAHKNTSRPKRASKRLSRDSEAVSLDGQLHVFKQPSLPPSRKPTLPKDPTAQGFAVPLVLPDGAATPRATRSNKGKPEIHEFQSKLGVTDLKDLVESSKEKLRLPDFQYRDVHPTSSITASSIPSTSLNDDSSLSSISSAPGSPELEASREQFTFPNLGAVKYYNPQSAKCPICQEPVERVFLEEFDSGERLNVRQQARFCKAHKKRSAEKVWQAKGYPKIDWTRLGDRLKKFHAAVDDILKGNRPSFYRNVFEDQMKTGRNRTLQQSLLSGQGFEGLTPGYYGSKGSRLITESIMTSFAPKIRRLAISDKLISSAGVAGYVQAVLAPELAIRLVMEDMHMDEEEAREALNESREMGELLWEEEDEIIADVEEEEGKGKEKGDGVEGRGLGFPC